ncbi:hypothetical protein SCAR479_14046 [Seiridium cardinale]|uniref:Uncharacterized protein n=1 Tax=Seiridium cardinale TaxID=138064 RepID=A0ABR2X6B8_9PEZI
MDKPKNRV